MISQPTLVTGGAVQVHDRVFQVQAGYGADGMVLLYLVRGTRVALIDTGIGTSPIQDVRPALKGLGLDLSDVDFILNTHGHGDHLGGNAALKREAPRAQIHLHGDDRPFAESHEFHRTFMTEFLTQFGRADQVPARGASILAMLGDGDAGVDRVLDDGDRIDLGGGVELTALHTPGHTPGSVCFYWEQEKLLVAGDAVQARGSRGGGYPLYFNASSYRRSLGRLLDLPIETLCLGHGFHSRLPLNLPVKHGAQARHMLDESAGVARVIDEAVRLRLAAYPDASNLEIAQGAVIDLLDQIPAMVDPVLKLPLSGGATLWAHVHEARPGG